MQLSASKQTGVNMAERSALYWQVYQRLTDDEEIDDKVRSLVEAAFDGSLATKEEGTVLTS